jgi:HEAT repeat protein
MTETLNTLLEELHHFDRDVRSRAAISLGNLGDANTLDALLEAICAEPDFFVREDLTWALVRMGEVAIQPLIDLLQADSPSTRHQAAHVLGKIGDVRATEALINALQDSNPEVVSKAAFTLGQFGDVRAIPALVNILNHESREVQETLVSVLENFGAASIPYLVAAIKSENPQTRELVADILGLLHAKEAINPLIEMLNDEYWQVRFAVVNALGHIGGAQAKEVIQLMHGDSEVRVRELVPKMLKRIKR